MFGTPFLVHGFMHLEVHKRHHHIRGYATDGDGEYMTLIERRRTFLATLLLWNLLLPFLGLVRFGLMVPMGFLSPRFRSWVYQNLSMAGMKFRLPRQGPADHDEAAEWRRHELMSMAFCWATAAGTGAHWLPLAFVAQWYLVMAGFATLNAVRGIAAHRYALRNDDGDVPLLAQLRDSLNVTGKSLSTCFLCPHGIQYHALHHIFPGIPYHALAAAHQRLVRDLPADAPYHAANVASIGISWRGLVASMRPAPWPWRVQPTIAAS